MGFGHSFRSQLDTMQSAQQAQRMDSEAAIVASLDGKFDRQQQVLERINYAIESNIRELADRSSKASNDHAKDLSRYLEHVTRSQNERAQDLHSAVASANAHAAECGDKVSALAEQLGCNDPVLGSSPHQRPSYDSRSSTSLESRPTSASAANRRYSSNRSTSKYQRSGLPVVNS